MMKKILKIISVLMVAICATISTQGMSYGEYSGDYAYYTDKFITNIKVNKDYTFDVSEKIEVDFKSPKHGLFRVIPERYGDSYVEDIKVEGYKYRVSRKEVGKNTTINIVKIGDKNTYVEGKKTYRIDYRIRGYINKNNKDMFRLNLIPTNWQTPIKYARTTVEMPTEIKFDSTNLYYGSFKDSNKIDALNKDRYRIENNGNKFTLIMNNLPEKNGVTLVKKIKDGYWINPSNHKEPLVILDIIFAGILILSFVMYMRVKQRKNIVKTVEFHAPNGITPAEAKYVLFGSIGNSDIISTLIYLAYRGYMSISDTKEDYILKKKSNLKKNEKKYVARFFNSIFDNKEEITMNELSSTDYFYSEICNAKDSVEAMYSGEKAVMNKKSIEGYFITGILTIIIGFVFLKFCSEMKGEYGLIFVGIIYSILNIIIMILIFVYNRGKYLRKSNAIMISIIIVFILINAGLISYFFMDIIYANIFSIIYILISMIAINMLSRTDYNISLLGGIIGFKEFIEKVELQKLKLLVEENPMYFYEILPYAYVFGLSDKWIKKFAEIDIPKPDWYDSSADDFTLFSCIYWMNYCSNNIASNLSDGDYSSSDYFGGSSSGGNYSGGGFGGGGGGAW